MMKHWLLILGICMVATTSVSAATCKEAVMPQLPDPIIAEEEDVLRAQAAVKHYLKLQEYYLECVSSPYRHDAAVDRMREITRRYNNLARYFKMRMKSSGMYTDLALKEDM